MMASGGRRSGYDVSSGRNGAQGPGNGHIARSVRPPGATDVASNASAASVSTSGGVGGSTIHSNVNVRFDMNASALSVDATGSFAVLAGRKGLHLVDLESPFQPPATLHHQTKLEVSVVKCNPHALFKGHVASSSNRNTLIWDIANVSASTGGATSIGGGQGSSRGYKHGQHNGLGSSSGANGNGPIQATTQPLVTTLRAHTRPVSDVAWSPMEPSLLATCSADAKTLLWDLRSPQRPVQTLNAFNSSVVQVEWNRVDATSLATAHDGEVRVWDLRAAGEKAVAPAALITAHMQKIYGLDWHPQRMYELLTCSEDKTVKFWDVTQPRVSQGILTTGAPVWRAQYTPFGDGLVTISQRVDNTLRLWALSHGDGNENGGNGAETDPSGANSASSVTAELVHSFVGHGDLVKGMAWRVRPQTGMYQLVSWSKDQELRLWRVNAPQLEACGYDTASYLADAVPSEGGNGNGLQPEDLRLLRAEFEEMHMPQSKYNMSAVKADFVPLVVPKSAVPLSTEEYTLEGNDSSLQALLALEEELIKGGEPQSQSPAGSDDENSPLEGERVDGKMDASPGTKERAASAGGARALPCPRISGACFSGPNMLLVFDSRVAIGQSRNSAVIPTTVAAGKVIKPQVAPNKLPRTYEELLDLRDSRFATKKNKKPPVKLLSSSNILGAMDLAANEWAGQQQQELIDGGGGIGVFSDDVENHSGASHGFRTSSMFYSSGSGSGGNDGIGASGGEMDMSIHGGSEYLKTYFSSAEYHLPVNHPEHLLSVPTSATPGLALSPRASTIRANNAERSKRVEQAAPVLNLDLSLSVTILDLSKLCGVSSILTYQTDLAPRDVTPAALLPNSSAAKRRRGQLGSVNRSMVSWMLRASEQMSRKHGVASENYLGRVLQELSAGKDGVAPNPAEDEENAGLDEADALLAATCAQNARVALLAGRNDLQQIWSLLEISTAPAVELPIYKKNGSNASSLLELTTRHPWSAHPFGKRLVHKVLGMYEQVGDVQALASIVCALKPSERKERQDLLDPAASSALAMEEHFVKVSGSKNASGGDVLSEAIDSTAAAGSNDGLRPPSRRSSSNALSQLTGNFADLGDTPPAMRSTRRSISHSDIAHFQSGDRLAVDKDAAALRPSRDWPLVAGSSGSTATSSRFSSPIRENVDPSITISTRSRETPTKASMQAGSSGWKMDFERLENPFKTWSGNSSAKDLSPPRISAEMFQRPVQPTSGASPATTTMAMTLSPRITPIPPSPLLSSSVPSIEEEDVNPNDRMQLQLIFRSVDDEKCLLSSLPEDEARYDVYKEAYAEVLYRYGAMDLRNEVLKTMSHSSQEAGGVTMGLVCSSCNARTVDPVCSSCRDFAVRCSVCQLVVRGQSMFCMTCGHGGHAAHLREWFEVETACPTGCGCWCKQATATLPPFPLETPDHTAQSRSHSF